MELFELISINPCPKRERKIKEGEFRGKMRKGRENEVIAIERKNGFGCRIVPFSGV